MKTPTTFKEYFKLLLVMIFHPLGITKFMRMMNADLDLGPAQSKMNIIIGSISDIIRFIVVMILIGAIYIKVIGG